MLAKRGGNEGEIDKATLLAQRAEFDGQVADELQRLTPELQTRQGILRVTRSARPRRKPARARAGGKKSSEIQII
jgi:hypothetical protein